MALTYWLGHGALLQWREQSAALNRESSGEMTDIPDQAVPSTAPVWPASGLTLETALAASLPRGGQTGAAPPARPRAWRWMRRPHGLRAGLWLLMAIGLLPALAGTVWYLLQLRDLALRDAFAQADLMASGTAEALRWQVQDAQVLLTTVAARQAVRTLDPGQCDPLFPEFQSLAPAHKALSLRRSNGQSVCSSLSLPPTAADVASTGWFKEALSHDGFHVSGVHIGQVQGVWTVRFTHPVKGSSGRAEGLLISPLDLGLLHERIFTRLPAVARVAVIDAENRVVLQSQNQAERVGKQAVAGVAHQVDLMRAGQPGQGGASTEARQFVGDGFDGPPRLFALRPVAQTGWMVVASLPLDETLRGYRRSRNRALTAVLLVLLGVAAAAWRVGRGILEPIRGLADAARGVAAGDHGQRAPETGPREIAAVAHEFNRMVQADSVARAQLHASETHYRLLIENLPVAVVTHRPDSAIELFNPRACMLLRLSPAQMEGRMALDHAWHFVDAQGRRLAAADYPVSRLLRTRQALPPAVYGIVSEVPGQPAVPHTWVMVTGYPQFDRPGVLQRVIVAFVDVSDQRQAEALRLARDSAEAASKAKSLFLSRVSHELRTPLNAINGFSELVLMDPQLPAASKDKLNHVLNAGRHLLQLINQVLDLSQAETNGAPATLQPVALWPLLTDCVALCSPLAQARGVVLDLPAVPADGAPPRVLADPTRLRQVLINLLSNAIKYNRPEGLVSLRCEVVPAVDGAPALLRLAVRDTGPGLSAAQQAALFQPFNRLGAEYSGIEGHGLGLSIARVLAQAMAGDILVDSAPGQGATFTLQLRQA